MAVTTPIADAPASSARPARLLAALAILGLVAASDWATGPTLDFSLFYLIPVCFVTWKAGRGYGYLVSVLAAVVWMIVDRLTGARPPAIVLAIWNTAARLTFFAGSVLLLGASKGLRDKLSGLVDQRTAALRSLAAQLSAAEDAQRRQLAYDMHDTLIQSLSLVKMNIDESLLADAQGAPARERLIACASMTDDVIRQIRNVTLDLYPAMLDDLGFMPTLEWYAKEFERRTSVEVQTTEQGKRLVLPPALRNYLFRAIKELLSNAVRHGRAREMVVGVHWGESLVRLVVDDDGTGFNVAMVGNAEPWRGLGLAGIRERVYSMGGRLDLESAPGQGARVIIEVPVSSDSEREKANAFTPSAG